MKKLTIALGALILIGLFTVFVLPFFMGLWIQKEYPKIVNTLSSNQGISIKILAYNRGWFSSNARIQINLNNPLLKLNKYPDLSTHTSISINEHINHGPFIIAKSTEGKKELVFAAALIHNQTNLPGNNLQSSTKWTFGNTLNSHFIAKKISFGSNQQKIQLSGLQGGFSYTPGSQHIKANVNLKQINIHIPAQGAHTSESVITINNINTKGDYSNSGPLWYGMRTLSADQITVNTPNKAQLIIKNISAKIQQNQKQLNTNIVLLFETQLFHGPNMQWGPAQLQLKISGLHTKNLINFMNRAAAVQQMARPKAAVMIYQPFMALIGQGLTIKLDKLFLRTPKGPIDANAELQVKAQNGTPSLPGIMKNLLAHASLQIPKPLLLQHLTNTYKKKQLHKRTSQHAAPKKMAEQQIQQWISTNVLTQSGDILSMTVNFQQGRLLINGKPYEKNRMTIKPQPTSAHTIHHRAPVKSHNTIKEAL